jgi:hypothetical protein
MKPKIYTTFAILRARHACQPRYQHLAKALGGIRNYGKDTPITLLQIIDANGIEDTLWAFRAVADECSQAMDELSRRFACRCVRETRIDDERTCWDLLGDDRSRTAVEVAERFAAGEATDDELTATKDEAWAASRDAVGDADAAWAAARAAAWAISRNPALDAAWASAWAAAWAAVGAADAALDAALEQQAGILREMLVEWG